MKEKDLGASLPEVKQKGIEEGIMVERVPQSPGHHRRDIDDGRREIDEEHGKLSRKVAPFPKFTVSQLEFSGLLEEKKNESEDDLNQKGYSVVNMKEHAYSASLV